jgi:hypothetical protein
VTARAQFAATDMLHRRVPLPFRFQFALEGSAVFIKTNSMLIGEALRNYEPGRGRSSECGVTEWEISVEICDECFPLSTEAAEEQSETYWFGPSWSVRMIDGSWFTRTPPSLNGVGFAFVAGNECQQVQQLATYLRTIQSFAFGKTNAFCLPQECEVSA